MATGLPYKAPVQDAPQYANFDVSKTAAHEDALPAMPSWETANSTKVYLEEEDVEMDNLKKPENTTQTAPLLNAHSGSPGPRSPSPLGSPSPVGPYGASRSPTGNTLGGGHPAVSNGYLAAGAIPTASGAGADPYGRGGSGYSSPQQSGIMDYGAELEDNNYGGYGGGALAAGAMGAGAMGPGRQSPRQYNNQQPGYGGVSPPPQQQQGGYGRPNQGPNGGSFYDGYGRSGNNTPQGYGMDRRSPRVPDVGMDNRTPRMPDVGGMDTRSPRIPELGSGSEPDFGVTGGPNRYASPGPYGPPSSRSPANARPMNNRAPPQRQYSGPAMGNGSQNNISSINTNSNNNNNYGPAEMPASPTLQNSGGFDFLGGQSRPSARGQDSYGSSGNNNYNGGYSSSSSRPLNLSTSPPPLQQPQPDRPGYPGYRAYRS